MQQLLDDIQVMALQGILYQWCRSEYTTEVAHSTDFYV